MNNRKEHWAYRANENSLLNTAGSLYLRLSTKYEEMQKSIDSIPEYYTNPRSQRKK